MASSVPPARMLSLFYGDATFSLRSRKLASNGSVAQLEQIIEQIDRFYLTEARSPWSRGVETRTRLTVEISGDEGIVEHSTRDGTHLAYIDTILLRRLTDGIHARSGNVIGTLSKRIVRSHVPKSIAARVAPTMIDERTIVLRSAAGPPETPPTRRSVYRTRELIGGLYARSPETIRARYGIAPSIRIETVTETGRVESDEYSIAFIADYAFPLDGAWVYHAEGRHVMSETAIGTKLAQLERMSSFDDVIKSHPDSYHVYLEYTATTPGLLARLAVPIELLVDMSKSAFMKRIAADRNVVEELWRTISPIIGDSLTTRRTVFDIDGFCPTSRIIGKTQLNHLLSTAPYPLFIGTVPASARVVLVIDMGPLPTRAAPSAERRCRVALYRSTSASTADGSVLPQIGRHCPDVGSGVTRDSSAAPVPKVPARCSTADVSRCIETELHLDADVGPGAIAAGLYAFDGYDGDDAILLSDVMIDRGMSMTECTLSDRMSVLDSSNTQALLLAISTAHYAMTIAWQRADDERMARKTLFDTLRRHAPISTSTSVPRGGIGCDVLVGAASTPYYGSSEISEDASYYRIPHGLSDDAPTIRADRGVEIDVLLHEVPAAHVRNDAPIPISFTGRTYIAYVGATRQELDATPLIEVSTWDGRELTTLDSPDVGVVIGERSGRSDRSDAADATTALLPCPLVTSLLRGTHIAIQPLDLPLRGSLDRKVVTCALVVDVGCHAHLVPIRINESDSLRYESGQPVYGAAKRHAIELLRSAIDPITPESIRFASDGSRTSYFDIVSQTANSPRERFARLCAIGRAIVIDAFSTVLDRDPVQTSRCSASERVGGAVTPRRYAPTCDRGPTRITHGVVIDIGAGKGMDMTRWVIANAKCIIAIDQSSDDLFIGEHELTRVCSRLDRIDMSRTSSIAFVDDHLVQHSGSHRKKPILRSIVADLGRGLASDGDDTELDALDQVRVALSGEHLFPRTGASCISLQFAMERLMCHSTASTAIESFKLFCRDHLCRHGRIGMTLLDGGSIARLLETPDDSIPPPWRKVRDGGYIGESPLAERHALELRYSGDTRAGDRKYYLERYWPRRGVGTDPASRGLSGEYHIGFASPTTTGLADVRLIDPRQLVRTMSDEYHTIVNWSIIDAPTIIDAIGQVFSHDYTHLREALSDEDYEMARLIWLAVLEKK